MCKLFTFCTYPYRLKKKYQSCRTHIQFLDNCFQLMLLIVSRKEVVLLYKYNVCFRILQNCILIRFYRDIKGENIWMYRYIDSYSWINNYRLFRPCTSRIYYERILINTGYFGGTLLLLVRQRCRIAMLFLWYKFYF